MATFFGGRDENYRLHGSAFEGFTINGAARDQLSAMLADECHDIADAVADTANAGSTYGGYKSYHQDVGATVAGLNAGPDTDRARRMLTARDTIGQGYR